MPIREDIAIIREDFPILKQKVHQKQLVYFDNAASTLKPKSVIQRVIQYYQNESSNIHRGIHYLSEKGTKNYEDSREKVRNFLNARLSEEIIFTSGTTQSINLIARTFGIQKNDEIIISAMEHHSNIVPWQILCEKTGAKLRVIPIDLEGNLIVEQYEKLLSTKTKLVSIVAISNTLGTVNDLAPLIKMAHQAGAKFVVDAAQATSQQKLDVQKLDCDFLAFSGHKIYGPTGIGILYGKKELLESLPPFLGGGDMVDTVTFEKTTYAELPAKFEAGTPNIAGAIALEEAIKYIENLGFEKIDQIKNQQLSYFNEKLRSIAKVHIIGNAKNKIPIFSFVVDGIHPHDLATFLDQDGIAIRTGHHCTQPIMDFFKISSACRASLSIYNTLEEIDYFCEKLEANIKMLS